MKNTIQAIKKEMTLEWDAYSAMLVLARDKKQAIIINNVERINQIIQLEQELLQQIKGTCEKQRDLFLQLAKITGRENPVLTDIIEIVTDEKEKRELLKLQNNFKELVRDLQWENDVNRRLLHTQLQYTNLSLSYLYGEDAVGSMYANTGYVNGEFTPRRGFIDQEV